MLSGQMLIFAYSLFSLFEVVGIHWITSNTQLANNEVSLLTKYRIGLLRICHNIFNWSVQDHVSCILLFKDTLFNILLVSLVVNFIASISTTHKWRNLLDVFSARHTAASCTCEFWMASQHWIAKLPTKSKEYEMQALSRLQKEHLFAEARKRSVTWLASVDTSFTILSQPKGKKEVEWGLTVAICFCLREITLFSSKCNSV